MERLTLPLFASTAGLSGLLVFAIARAFWTRKVAELKRQLALSRRLLTEATQFDALTHLVNRQGFVQAFNRRLQDGDSELAVLFLDIDHFKRINDSLGHEVGDELLTTISRLLAQHLPEGTLIGRLAGDEFCILLNASRREAQDQAKQLLRLLSAPLEVAGRAMAMTSSIGISLAPQDGSRATELLNNADLALYQAKASGRNCVNFFDGDLRVRATLQLQLEEELHSALHDDGGLELFYQPIFDVRSGHLAKLEALVRWRHPQHGLLTPDRFIGIAEANGLIAALDGWVLRRACKDLAHLGRNDCAHVQITVNCSALNLARDGLPDEVASALADAGVPPQRLELEITENALMANIGITAPVLHRIRDLGVSLSIDDFGTGYSSLAYLKRLPLNTLKIDRSFIQEIPRSRRDMEIVQAIIVMAHSLHLQVVTEGVETSAQHAFLRNCQCDYVQGYLLGRPVPLGELRPLLEANYRRRDAVVTERCSGTGDLFDALRTKLTP